MKRGLLTIISGLVGMVMGVIATVITLNSNKKVSRSDKYKIYYNTLNQWLKVKNEGKNLESYFVKNNYHTIAIYGMGELGNRFYEEIKNSKLDLKYAIDQNAQYTYSNLKLFGINDNFDKVDAIIVTAVFAFDEIKASLQNKTEADIISIEDIVFEV